MFLHELGNPLDEGGFRQHLVESSLVRVLEAERVLVVRVPEDRDVRIRVRHLLRLDPRDIRDHEVGQSALSLVTR